MRLSEIFGLRRGRVKDDYVEIMERVCKRDVDTPKTVKAVRRRAKVLETLESAFVN